jgi:hypothetical protein
MKCPFVPHIDRPQDPELHLAGLPARDLNSCYASETDLKRVQVNHRIRKPSRTRCGKGMSKMRRNRVPRGGFV